MDTGSEISLIDANSVSIKGLNLKTTGIKPCTINSQPISVKGTVSVNVEIGTLTTCWTFLVVDGISSRAVLGIDFIRAHAGDSWGFSKGQIYLGKYWLPIQQESTYKEWNRPAVARCAVTLPPRSQILIPMRSKDKLSTDTGIFEGGVLFSKSVNNGDQHGQFWARAVNLTNETLNIFKNQRVGTISSVQSISPCINVHSEGDKAVPQKLRDLGVNLDSAEASPENKDKLAELLVEYSDVFSSSPGDIGHYRGVQHPIRLKPDSVPVRQPVRRIPFAYQTDVKEQIQRMLKNGIIEKSVSPWASPLVILKKSSGDLRICVDYRAVNAQTVKNSHPLPNITATLERLAGCRWFTSFDLVSGYHQIDVAPNDREITAFVSPYGLYQYRRLPFGLCNAGSTFQRVVDDLLQTLSVEDVVSYLDDFICFHKTFAEHLTGIRRILQMFRDSGFKLAGKKCQFAKKEVSFLGHLVSEKGLKPQPSKISAIVNWPTPTTADALLGFLGLIGFYRKFIKNFADISAVLFDKLESGFRWDDSKSKAFEELKRAMAEEVVLKLPEPDLPFILTCDASGVALGYVLEQVDRRGSKRPVAFGSRKLNKTEQKYSATEKECLAIVDAIKAYRPYLLDREFTLYTDHQALKWLLSKSNTDNGRLWRWVYKLSEYSFVVHHKPGKENVVADALSRIGAVTLDRIWTVEEMAAEQQADPELRSPYTWLQRKRGKLTGTYKNFASHLSIDPVNHVMLYDKDKIVLPISLQRTALELCHDNHTACHLGVQKTLEILKSRYFWPGMNSDTEHWVKSCLTCQERKPPHRHAKAPLGEMPMPTAPMEYVQIDLKGYLTQTISGNRYLMVVYDYFSKYIVAVPIPDKRMETVTEAFIKNVVLVFGLPGGLCSDQGKEFENRLLWETCRLLGIEKVRTSVCHPASNGGVERANRTIGNLLRSVIRTDQIDWDKRTPYVIFAYNSSKHASTELSPYEIMYGLRKPRLPTDLSFGTVKPNTLGQNDENYQEKINQAFKEVGENLSRARVQQKHQAEKKVNYVPIQKGEKVWLKNWKKQKGLNHKLMPYWRGPYTVVRKISDVSYLIRKDGGRSFVIHHNLVHRFIDRSDKWKPGSTDSDMGKDENTVDSLDRGYVMYSDNEDEPSVDNEDEPLVDLNESIESEDANDPIEEAPLNETAGDHMDGEPVDILPPAADPADIDLQEAPIPQVETVPIQITTRAGRRTRFPTRLQDYDCSS